MANLHTFLKTYFPHTTGLKPFSPAHKRAIKRTQLCLENGGQFLQVVFRGWAKSTIIENAAIWAALKGLRRYLVPIAADRAGAAATLAAIQTEIETNDLLAEDFPEVCHAVRALEGKSQRCASQTHKGKLTHIVWTSERVVLPTIEGSAASGAIIEPRGITGGLRGMRYRRPDGEQVRPDAVLLDDIQSDESARSPYQCEARIRTINRTILRLGGHESRLAAICNATIIEPDDAVAQLTKVPAWQSEQIKMLDSLPADMDIWLESYAARRNNYNPEDPEAQEIAHKKATAFYRRNRRAMDRGAKASWQHCYDETTELSAIQHAMNILIDTGLDAWLAECQCEPPGPHSDIPLMKPGALSEKVGGFLRQVVPPTCDTLTAFIDVQGKLLYWKVLAWDQWFSGYLLDYGTWPDQKRKYFSLRDAKRTLQRMYGQVSVESAIHAGLLELIEQLAGREYFRGDDTPQRISRIGVDANWGGTSTVVNMALRQSAHAAILTPCYGRGIKATHQPISQWEQSRGQNAGPEWVPAKPKPGFLRGLIYDANYWKARFFDGLNIDAGGRGAIVFYRGGDHRMLADHILAETPHEVTSGGRTVFEFEAKPNQDNHFLDCGVGSMVIASVCGVGRPKIAPRKRKKRKARTL